jgi:hypothetical protein
MMTYRPLNAALNQKNYEEVLKIADSVLAKNFVEINAHMAAQIAHQELGITVVDPQTSRESVIYFNIDRRPFKWQPPKKP